MTEEQQKAGATELATSPGALLKQERERQGIEKQRIAGEMHLGVAVIEAIEDDRFAVLGAPVYARGHLRKYATLLGVPVDKVLGLYQTLSDKPALVDPVPIMHSSSEPSIPMRPDSKQRREQRRPVKWVAVGLLILVLVAAASGWWLLRGRGGDSAVTTPTASNSTQLEPSSTASVEATQAAPLAVTDAANAAGRSQSSASAASAPEGPIAQDQAHPKIRVRFAFRGESWVEVYDWRGTRVLYDVGQPQQSRAVEVEVPARVVLGSASGVSVEANGKPVSIPARRIASSVARFTLNGDGVAQ